MASRILETKFSVIGLGLGLEGSGLGLGLGLEGPGLGLGLGLEVPGLGLGLECPGLEKSQPAKILSSTSDKKDVVSNANYLEERSTRERPCLAFRLTGSTKIAIYHSKIDMQKI